MAFNSSLHVLVRNNNKVVFDKYFSNLQGNYLFGRSCQKCLSYAEHFSEPTQIITFPEIPDFVSNFHAVICCLDNCCIIDGWGDYYSKNGIYVNGSKTTYKKLENRDVIHLGHDNFQITFFENNEEQIEKETDSQNFEVRKLFIVDGIDNNYFDNNAFDCTAPLSR